MFAEWIRPEHRSLPGEETERVKIQSEILELRRPAEVIGRKGDQQGCGLMIDG